MWHFWRSAFSENARFLRLGTILVVLALIVWISVDTIHDGAMPSLKRPAEFLAGAVAVFYGIDKAAGRLRRSKSGDK